MKENNNFLWLNFFAFAPFPPPPESLIEILQFALAVLKKKTHTHTQQNPTSLYHGMDG